MTGEGPKGAGTVLHLGPHPDDELIGAPATLMALRDGGWTVVNVACSLGADSDRARRRAELATACARAGFVCETLEPLPDPLPPGDGAPSGRRLVPALTAIADEYRPAIVVAPSPHDRHRGHEAVGRAALEVCAGSGTHRPERLWLWGLWADLPFPSLAVGFDDARLEEILSALGAHAGELARNDYRRLVRGRAEMNAVLGAERVFGFGSVGATAPYVEVLSELGRNDGRWQLGVPRWLDVTGPIGGLGTVVLDDWLSGPSLTDRFGPPG